jgi:hypothetical protein
MPKTPQELEELAAEFERADHSAGVEAAERIEPPSEPMITFSFRVPRETADEIRAEAARQNRKPTALLRMWAEERLACERPAGATSDDLREEEIMLVRQAVHEELAAAGLIGRSRKSKMSGRQRRKSSAAGNIGRRRQADH